MREFNIPAEIVKFANSMIGTDFVFGERDCVYIARKGWEIVTGRDILGDLIPEYSTREDAEAAYDRVGLIQEQLASVGGYEIPLSRVVHGDLVFPEAPETDGFQNIGLVCGKNVLTTSVDEGTFMTYPKRLLVGLDGYIAYRVPTDG